MFFRPEFRLPFTLKGKKFFVASLTPKDKTQIREGLKFMSAESIRNRFMGSKKDFTEKELDYLTSFDGINHYALGVEEDGGAHRGVAVIRMVRSELNPNEAEVAITIIDEYQKMGLGSFLLDLLYLAARERNIDRFSFTFLPSNEGIERLIQKKGISKLVRSHDTVQMIQSLTDVNESEVRARVRSILPAIDSGHSGT
jgi:acetyltransferase